MPGFFAFLVRSAAAHRLVGTPSSSVILLGGQCCFVDLLMAA